MASKLDGSLFEYLIKKVGPINTRKVLGFMTAWGMVEADLGHEPTIEEYSVWWKQSAATSYREKATLRECFPNESSPSRLNHLASERLHLSKQKMLGNITAFKTLKVSDLI